MNTISLTEEDLKKIITIETLQHYDKNIKKWVANQIADYGESGNTSINIVFDEKENFPAIGQSNILYVDKIAIYQWDDSENKYSELGYINAKAYADTLNSDMNTRVEVLEEKFEKPIETATLEEINSLFID